MIDPSKANEWLGFLEVPRSKENILYADTDIFMMCAIFKVWSFHTGSVLLILGFRYPPG